MQIPTGNRMLAYGSLLVSSVSAADDPTWISITGSPSPYWGSNWNGFYSSEYAMNQARAAHAITASAVWLLILPVSGILLRLNIRSPWVVRLHAALQITGYLAYGGAVGAGVWLIRNMGFADNTVLWRSPHPALGLAVLVLTAIQLTLGVSNHLIQKSKNSNKGEVEEKTTSRTMISHIHVWLGRFVIVLAGINGALGIRLGAFLPLDTSDASTALQIGYGVSAGFMLVVYLILVIRGEVMQSKWDRKARDRILVINSPPSSYSESFYSFEKEERVPEKAT